MIQAKSILVIGNGFDLHHGLKTRYNDFIEYIGRLEEMKEQGAKGENFEKLYQISANNGFIQYFLKYTREVPGWIDLENEIQKILNVFKKFFINFRESIDAFRKSTFEVGYGINNKKSKILLISILKKFKIISSNAVRFNRPEGKVYIYEFVEDYYSPLYGLNKKEILKMLKKELEELIQALRIYLGVFIYKQSETQMIEKSIQIENICADYVINFNYTDTCKQYGISDNNICYIHGSIKKNDMVLGIKDEDSSDLDFIYFKKYFQQIQKRIKGFDIKNLDVLSDKGIVKKPIVYFYGHSLDDTDGDIIRKLIKGAGKCIVYYYNQEDYEQKVINLIDVLTKDEALQLFGSNFIEFQEIIN